MSNILKSPKNSLASYIIKQQEAHDSIKKVEETVSIESAQERAESIISEAKIKSEHILQQAESERQETEEYIKQQREFLEMEKEKIAQESSQIGYQEGYGEGRRDADKDYSKVLQEIKKTLSLTKEQKEKFLEEMEPQLLESSIRIAKKIMNLSLEEEPTRFMGLIKKVVQEVKEENDIKIYIHPSFCELVHERKEELKALLHQDAMLSVYPEETLEETQCIVESSFGRIEGGVDEQLQQIKQALTKCLEKG